MTTTDKSAATISSATKRLLFIAARSHSLRDQMGIDLRHDEENDREFLFFRPGVSRPWLVPKYAGSTELTFEPDIYAKTLGCCSDGENWMRLWILNVWNPGAAESKGWHFDFFKALRVLDSRNLAAIAWLCENPILP